MTANDCHTDFVLNHDASMNVSRDHLWPKGGDGVRDSALIKWLCISRSSGAEVKPISCDYALSEMSRMVVSGPWVSQSLANTFRSHTTPTTTMAAVTAGINLLISTFLTFPYSALF